MLKFQPDNTFDTDLRVLPRNLVFQKSFSPAHPREVVLPGNQSVHLHPIGFDCVRESFPPKMSWSEFPVVVEPTVTLVPRQGGTSDFLTPEQLAGYWGQQDFFLVDHGDGADSPKDRYLLNAVAYSIREKFAPGKGFAIRSGVKDDFRLVDDEFMKFGLTDWKFSYCYKLNFRAIGFEIVRRFADVTSGVGAQIAGSTRRYIEALRERWLKRSAAAFDEPLALQVLFALEAADKADLQHAYGIAANFQGSSNGYTLGKMLVEGKWIGSGKYQPMSTNSAAISTYLLTFVALGFAELKDDLIVVTPAGGRFLAALHKNNYDPDAIIRFVSPESGIVAAAAQESVEEWLQRFFRKMKQRGS